MEAPDYKNIGKLIRENRCRYTLTQEKLAELVGVSPEYISKIETGKSKVSLSILIKIANVLNVSLDDLVAGSLNKYKVVMQINELTKLLNGCSDNQKRIIIQSAESLKKILDENGVQ